MTRVPGGRIATGLLVGMVLGGEEGESCESVKGERGESLVEGRGGMWRRMQPQEGGQAGRCDLVGGWIDPTGRGQ